jgi:hypothetical protein
LPFGWFNALTEVLDGFDYGRGYVVGSRGCEDVLVVPETEFNGVDFGENYRCETFFLFVVVVRASAVSPNMVRHDGTDRWVVLVLEFLDESSAFKVLVKSVSFT